MGFVMSCKGEVNDDGDDLEKKADADDGRRGVNVWQE